MKISLITATYNSEKNISSCLQSVAGQSFKNIEHIVIDGGSKDSTLAIVKSFPSVSKTISEPDKGIYDALD
jgi:glycosyltransferase